MGLQQAGRDEVEPYVIAHCLHYRLELTDMTGIADGETLCGMGTVFHPEVITKGQFILKHTISLCNFASNIPKAMHALVISNCHRQKAPNGSTSSLNAIILQIFFEESSKLLPGRIYFNH